MDKNNGKLPIFGVGPIYVLTCLLLTVLGLCINYCGFINIGEIHSLKSMMYFVGIIFIIIGLVLWIISVLIQKITEDIKKGILVTTGVYAIVRNPIYSAFIFIFSGALFIASKWLLLFLPFVFWLYLTILMKLTEEKWLFDKFGNEYIIYCKKVNRVIPWFRK